MGTGALNFGDYSFEGEYTIRKHGKGKAMWGDGKKYDGAWFENRIEGMGTMEWADGRRYSGEWLDN